MTPGAVSGAGARVSAETSEAHPDADDIRHIRRALALAERGWGRVAPNPLVGAVVVREAQVVGEGWHAEYGGPHAEVAALEAAGEAARDATLYVSLEPCAHHGKTPPCTEAIVDAGIRRVVVACRDPHPEAAGGIETLRKRGVEVEVGVEAEAARRLNAPFLWWQVTGRPFVTLKLALSLDARIAEAPGTRTAVTGEEAAERTHRLRAGHDAVMVGSGTARVDDPLLTVRRGPPPRRPPRRIVLDARLRTPPDATLLETAEAAPSWILTAPGADPDRAAALEAAGARVLEASPAEKGDTPVGENSTGARSTGSAPGERGLDPEGVLELLAREGVRSILLEGGARVAASFLRADAVQRLHLFYAPVAFGPEGVAAFGDGSAWGRGRWDVATCGPVGADAEVVLERTAAVARLREAT